MGCHLCDFRQEERRIAAAGENQEISGALIAFLSQVVKGGRDEKGQFPVTKRRKNDGY